MKAARIIKAVHYIHFLKTVIVRVMLLGGLLQVAALVTEAGGVTGQMTHHGNHRMEKVAVAILSPVTGVIPIREVSVT